MLLNSEETGNFCLCSGQKSTFGLRPLSGHGQFYKRTRGSEINAWAGAKTSLAVRFTENNHQNYVVKLNWYQSWDR
jgi:hypothetical protein